METDNAANKAIYGNDLGAKEIVTGNESIVPAAKLPVSVLDRTSPTRK